MPPELWELIRAYGPAALPLGIVLYGWIDERAARKRSDEALIKALHDQIVSNRERAAVDHTGNQVIAALISKLSAKEAQ